MQPDPLDLLFLKLHERKDLEVEPLYEYRTVTQQHLFSPVCKIRKPQRTKRKSWNKLCWWASFSHFECVVPLFLRYCQAGAPSYDRCQETPESQSVEVLRSNALRNRILRVLQWQVTVTQSLYFTDTWNNTCCLKLACFSWRWEWFTKKTQIVQSSALLNGPCNGLVGLVRGESNLAANAPPPLCECYILRGCLEND